MGISQPRLFDPSHQGHVGQFNLHPAPLFKSPLGGALHSRVGLKGDGWDVSEQVAPSLLLGHGRGSLQDQPVRRLLMSKVKAKRKHTNIDHIM